MKKTILFIAGIWLAVSGCQPEQKKQPKVEKTDEAATHTLRISGKALKFEPDTVTSATTNCLFYYQIDSLEVLAYLNRPGNEIIIYDINTQKQLFKITPEKKGPNGVGIINGFHIVNFDSIYIGPTNNWKVFVIDRAARVIQTIRYGLTDSLPSPTPHILPQHPLVMDKGKIYLPSLPFGNWNGYKSYGDVPVCCVVDTATGGYTFLPMTYPEDYLDNGKKEPVYSRIKAGDNFVYSFFGDHHLYVTRDHVKVKKIWAGSAYFEEFKFIKNNPDMQAYLKYLAETPYYRAIVYDPFRKVYYRLVSLGSEVDNSDNLALLSRYPPNASIIILDSAFNKVGETRLPYGQFDLRAYFVAPEGLYVSENSPLNQTYTDESIRFRLLKLVTGEN